MTGVGIIKVFPRTQGQKPGADVTRYLRALVAVLGTFGLVWGIEAWFGDRPTAVLLYLLPVVLAAIRWGRGPAVLAVLISVLGHDLLFVEPWGALTIASVDDALGLVLFLFVALATAQLAESARSSVEKVREAEVARRSDDLKSALLRAVSHDLRTPLASIKASVSGLRADDDAYSGADRIEVLAAVEEEVDRLNRLVGNLLDASRVEGGALRPRKQPQDLAELARSALHSLRPIVGVRPLRLEIPDDLPLIPCDRAEMAQVLTNLLENAAIHTPADTPITLRARLDNTGVRIEVVDRGPGIPATERERLFRPFERGVSTARGTGLGLAIARGFVEAHGGHLWMEDAPVRGICLAFTLPLSGEREGVRGG